MGTVDDLTLLVEIVEAGSISAASRRIGISKSRLSRRIGDLENQLGVVLLKRGPRSFTVTEIGRSICESGKRIRTELKAVKALAEDSYLQPSGSLRVSCPAVFAELLVANFATEFATRCPGVQLTLNTSKGLFVPELDDYDLAIQPSRERLPDSEIVCQKLITAPFALVAAPALIGNLTCPISLSDLDNCDAIGWGADGYMPRWKLLSSDGRESEINVHLKFSTNSLNVVYRAALKGLGLARLPLHICKNDLDAGRLVIPIPQWAPPPISMYALYPSRRTLTRVGRAFVTELSSYLQEHMGK